jgi:hypothetical protein
MLKFNENIIFNLILGDLNMQILKIKIIIRWEKLKFFHILSPQTMSFFTHVMGKFNT